MHPTVRWGRDSDTERLSVAGCLLVGLIIICITVVPGSWCWDYTISRWLVYFGKADTFNMWPHGVLMAMIPGLGQAVFILAGLTWISTFFI